MRLSARYKSLVSNPALSKEIMDICLEMGASKNSALAAYLLTCENLPDWVDTQTAQLHGHYRKLLSTLPSADHARELVFAIAEDWRVFLLRLAYILATLRAQTDEELIQEALAIWIPIGERLGLKELVSEVQDIILYRLDPKSYRQIRSHILELENRYKDELWLLEAELIKTGALRVESRRKGIYSTYRKLSAKSLSQIYDLIGFRLIMPDEESCYRALAELQSKFDLVEERYKDYIARPRTNSYQSLHLGLRLAPGFICEVQIRTEEMHEQAERGVAAHHLYKGNDFLDKIRLMKETRPEEIYQQMIAHDTDVYVRTPKEEVYILKRGATPLDFAYRIHTQVGHRFAGAKVNGKIVAIDYVLQNGDRVEILRAPVGSSPSPEWMKIVRTARAKTAIRSKLRAKDRALRKEKGEKMLARQIADWEGSEEELLKNIQKLGYLDKDAYLIALGTGHASPVRLMRLLGLYKQESKKETPVQEPLRINIANMPIVLARCCKPVPGDEVAGYITVGRGISVHKIGCPQYDRLDNERKMILTKDLLGSMLK